MSESAAIIKMFFDAVCAILWIHYERPERRISLCWEASWAPTPGPRPGWGSVKA